MCLTLWYLVRVTYNAASLEYLECDFRVNFMTLTLLFIGKVMNTIYQPRSQSLNLLRVVVICLEVLRTGLHITFEMWTHKRHVSRSKKILQDIS